MRDEEVYYELVDFRQYWYFMECLYFISRNISDGLLLLWSKYIVVVKCFSTVYEVM